MEIWYDGANLSFYKKYQKMFAGITTNNIIVQNKKDFIEELRKEKLQETKTTLMFHGENGLKEYFDLSSMIRNTLINSLYKIPFVEENIPILERINNLKLVITSIYNTKQLLAALQYRAQYCVLIYHKNNKDINFIKESVDIAKRYSSKLIIGSFREFGDILLMEQLGVDAVTVREDTFLQIFKHHDLQNKEISNY